MSKYAGKWNEMKRKILFMVERENEKEEGDASHTLFVCIFCFISLDKMHKTSKRNKSMSL